MDAARRHGRDPVRAGRGDRGASCVLPTGGARERARGPRVPRRRPRDVPGRGARRARRDDVDVVGEAGRRRRPSRGIRATQPDVVLLDVHLPDGGGRGGARAAAAPSCRTSAVPGAVGVRRGRGRHRRHPRRRAGLRHEDDLRGRTSPTPSAGWPTATWCSAPAGRLRAGRLRAGGAAPTARRGGDPELDQLTPREREVLRLLARGYTYKEIALRAVHLDQDGRDARLRTCCASCSCPTATSSPAGRPTAGWSNSRAGRNRGMPAS